MDDCGQVRRRAISIHAPPRGATMRFRQATGRTTFQFTPLREGRLLANPVLFIVVHFNSRPSARGDNAIQAGYRADYISIHAPPRGATAGEPSLVYRSPFQFTPLREGRHHGCAHLQPVHYFNSRPSARGDSKRYAISANLLFNPYKSAWLNNNATQFVEIILVIFHRIIA